MSYGVPISIKAPEGSTVEANDLGIMKDVIIKSNEDYYVQVYASEATTLKVADVVKDQLNDVKNGPFFSKVIEEYEDGFIFEKMIDSTNINFGFRAVKIMGDQEYLFQTGLFGKFTEDQVRVMYESVK